MKIFKKILGSILFVALMLTAIIPPTLTSRVSEQESVNLNRIRISEFYRQEKNSLDVVYTGGSAVYRNNIAVQNYKEYGFTSMDFASAAQPFAATKYVLEEISKTQDPLYVVEVRQLVKDAVRESAGKTITEEKKEYYYDSLIGSMKYSVNRARMIKTLAPEDWFNWNFDFVRRHSNWQTMDEEYMRYQLFYQWDQVDYIETKCVNVTPTAHKYKMKDYSDVDKTTEIPEKTLAVLDDLLKYIKEKELQVLFVSTPFVRAKKYQIMENTVEQYLKKAGYDYLNCNNHYADIELDFKTDFSDKLHGNISGAEKITRFIGGYIDENYKLSKNHSENVTAQWDKALLKWEDKRELLYEEYEENID